MNKENLWSIFGFALLVIITIGLMVCFVFGFSVDVLVGYVSSNVFVAVYSICIICFAIWNFRGFFLKVSSSKTMLQSALSSLQSIQSEEGKKVEVVFAEAFNDFDSWMRNESGLAHCWSEFTETLILAEPDCDSEKPPVVKNTDDASSFFFVQELFGDINISLYRTVPNILTGLGILGTFSGLMAGIYLAKNGLQSDDPTQMKHALDSLLSGASLAFMTSIVGVWCSLAFSWGEKTLVHQLQALVGVWNAELDARLERVTPEKLGENQLAQLEIQTEHLETFVNEIAFNIGEQVGETMDKKLLPTLEKLTETVDRMRAEQAEANEKMLQDIVEKFSETMKDAAGKELQALSDTLNKLNQDMGPLISELVDAQKEMQGTAEVIAEEVARSYREGGELFTECVERSVESLEKAFVDTSEAFAKNLSETFEKSIEILNSTVESFDGVAEKIKETCEEGAETFRDGLNDSFSSLFTGINEAGENLKEQLEEALGGTIEKLGSVAIAMEAGASKLTESNEATSEVINETKELVSEFNNSVDSLKTMHNKALKLVEALGDSADSIEEGVSDVISLVKDSQTVADKMSSTSEVLLKSNEEISILWSDYINRFKDVDASLEKVFSDMTRQLEDYGTVMENYISGLDDHAASIVKELAGAVHEMRDATEEISDEFSEFNKKLEQVAVKGFVAPVDVSSATSN